MKRILPRRGRWPEGPEGVAIPEPAPFNPLSRCATAPPKGEHLALFAALALSLAACAPKAAAPAVVALDCGQSFDAMQAKITAQPGLVAAPEDAAEPYRAWSMADGKASYFITQPGAPAHPAILMQQAGEGGAMKNTGCAWGDKAAYGQLMAYLSGLKAGRK